jgi:hypothetical protein
MIPSTSSLIDSPSSFLPNTLVHLEELWSSAFSIDTTSHSYISVVIIIIIIVVIVITIVTLRGSQ